MKILCHKETYNPKTGVRPCGHELVPNDSKNPLYWLCDGCGTSWTHEVILRRHGSSILEPQPETPSAWDILYTANP